MCSGGFPLQCQVQQPIQWSLYGTVYSTTCTCYLLVCTCTWVPRGLLLMNSYLPTRLSRPYTETYVEVLHSILRLPLSACEFRMGSSTPTLWYIVIVESKVNSSVSELWLALESVCIWVKHINLSSDSTWTEKKIDCWSKVSAW